MKAREFIKCVFGRGKISTVDTSRRMSRSPKFIAAYVSGTSVPSVDLFAEILDAIGFDLLARNRKSGEETIIDPPEK